MSKQLDEAIALLENPPRRDIVGEIEALAEQAPKEEQSMFGDLIEGAVLLKSIPQ